MVQNTWNSKLPPVTQYRLWLVTEPDHKSILWIYQGRLQLSQTILYGREKTRLNIQVFILQKMSGINNFGSKEDLWRRGKNYTLRKHDNCTSKGVVYYLVCTCKKHYMGKIRELWRRIQSHIGSIYNKQEKECRQLNKQVNLTPIAWHFKRDCQGN